MNQKMVAKVALCWGKQTYTLTHPANMSLISATNEFPDAVITAWTPNRSKESTRDVLHPSYEYITVHFCHNHTNNHTASILRVLSPPNNRIVFLPKTYQGVQRFWAVLPFFFHRDVTRVGWYQLLDPSAKLHSNAIKYNQQQSGTRLPHYSLARWVPTRQPQSVKCDRWNRPPREESGLWSAWWVCPLIVPSPLWPAEIISNHWASWLRFSGPHVVWPCWKWVDKNPSSRR